MPTEGVPMQSRRLPAQAIAALLLLAASAGCRNEMYDQQKYEPQEVNPFFRDGKADRPIVAGTVARIDLRGEPASRLLATGRLDDGTFTNDPPMDLSRADLVRGEKRYQIYCMPCHSPIGDGRGLIVERGFTAPPAFTDPELRAKPLGHYYDVITHGHGAMYSYAARIAPEDRWRIAAYIRVLQLSQGVPVEELAPADRQELEKMGRPPASDHDEAHPAGGQESHS
jgi:mono/diheme cytochrome c family protein